MSNERTVILGRMFLVFGLVLLLPVAIAFQILRIQILEGDNLRSLWSTQALDYISVPAQRGNILDASGRLLATNTVTYRVAVDPLAPGMKPEYLDDIATVLARHTNRTENHYTQRISSASRGSRYIVLEREVGYITYKELRDLGYRGIILEEQYKRRYNYDELAAHAVGFVNHEFRGMMGLEASFDEMLRGEDGIQQVRRDRSGGIRAVIGAPRKKPRQGYTVQTTIDANIQAIVEEELRNGVHWAKANYGTAIVMDPRTGAIKAMANYPTYDPNSPGTITTENRRNFAISDMIEPGSTFKLVTSIAAVEHNVFTEDEIFYTPESGQKMIHGQMMRDHNPLGNMSFQQVFQKSSNIATSEIAMRLTPDIFYQYARNMGFGTPTDVGLPNEESGRIRRPFEWTRVTLPWMSIGYEVQVTPIQIAQAYATFANNGIMMRPYIVDKILDERGKTIEETRPREIRRVIKPETVKYLKPVFQGVVSDSGTASFAMIDDFPIVGKTGTAQKFIDGRYQARYRASFAGFYPEDKPQYVTLIVLDEPRISYYGGFTAGTIFRNITTRIIGIDDKLQQKTPIDPNYEMLAHMPNLRGLDADRAKDVLRRLHIPFTSHGMGARVSQQTPEPGTPIVLSNEEAHLVFNDAQHEDLISSDHNIIPDVVQLSMRKASLMLEEAGFKVTIIGSGTVHTQFPAAGNQLRMGNQVTLRGRARDLPTILTQTTK